MAWVQGAVIDISDPAWEGMPESLDGEIYLGGKPETGIQTRAVVTLDEARSMKKSLMKKTASERIQSGIESDVLGAVHTYPTTITDQQNLAGLAQQASIDGLGAKYWCADDAGLWARRQHTADQLIQLGREVIAHVQAQQDRYETLLGQIDAASTVEEIEAIAW